MQQTSLERLVRMRAQHYEIHENIRAAISALERLRTERLLSGLTPVVDPGIEQDLDQMRLAASQAWHRLQAVRHRITTLILESEEQAAADSPPCRAATGRPD